VGSSPSYRTTLAWILAAGLGLRLVLALIMPPGYDESYYLFYGQNPALSYFDHPLAVGVWAGLGHGLSALLPGDPVLALRIPGLLSYTLALALLAEATRTWFGGRAGLLAAAVASLSPLLLACGGLLLLPDSPLVLVLSVLLWWLSRHPLHGSRTRLESLSFGLILGLLTLCKYHALLLILSLVGLRLLQSVQTQTLRWRDTGLVWLGWLGGSAPLWIWNLHNGWASFAFHSARTATAGGYRFDGPPLFLLSQLGLLFPTLGILLLLSLGQKPGPDARQAEAITMLRWLAIPQLVAFLVLAGRMQVLSSWLVPAWWLLVPLGGRWLASSPGPRGLWFQVLRWGTVVSVPLLSLVAAAHVRWGVAGALLPPALDTSGQLMTPQALRQALRQNPNLWRALSEAQIIASNRYELPGFLALALQGYSPAQYTSYSLDSRGFDQWRVRLNPQARRGVLFAVVGDYNPVTSLRQPLAQGLGWMVPELTPLGEITVKRSGQPAAVLEFYAFDPSRVQHQLPPRPSQ